MPPFAGINEFYLSPLVVFGGMESFTALILSAPGFSPPVVNRCPWKLTVVFSNSQFSRLRVMLWSSICWSSILNCGLSSPLLQPWYNLCCWGLQSWNSCDYLCYLGIKQILAVQSSESRGFISIISPGGGEGHYLPWFFIQEEFMIAMVKI